MRSFRFSLILPIHTMSHPTSLKATSPSSFECPPMCVSSPRSAQLTPARLTRTNISKGPTGKGSPGAFKFRVVVPSFAREPPQLKPTLYKAVSCSRTMQTTYCSETHLTGPCSFLGEQARFSNSWSPLPHPLFVGYLLTPLQLHRSYFGARLGRPGTMGSCSLNIHNATSRTPKSLSSHIHISLSQGHIDWRQHRRLDELPGYLGWRIEIVLGQAIVVPKL